ncbi:methyltransferase domain-containing protein [Croceibacterium sp. LX-88]|uniref:Methyltransferase domain-containing protein n=1 Tax=Croceibacterium selenioxidans TaxID=2838833 RepID=A0ABS5W4J6_9SPHN|nr:class I SAM-dependent methyltransferase [Croceibacterium selenioxidans]MBT2134680.1 methyltransferase domain-containing protein [Croceibacterium selenioxidans]
MTRSHDAVTEDQFGPQAAAYVASPVHAGGEDLDALESAAEREQPVQAADLGSGGGHVAYRLARHAGSVTAIDLSAAMMDAVRDTARQRGLSNIETCVAAAENLPFGDAAFDLLGCRFSAHHWRDFDAGLREARRVLKPGATAIFIDVVSPGHPVFDTHLQAVELLRDPSHVRNYAEAEWTAALARAGFRVRNTQKRRLRMDYQSWVDRMRTPEQHRIAIRSLQQGASTDTATYFSIEPDGSFSLDTLQLEATACRARSI